jgi:hypothetical protein
MVVVSQSAVNETELIAPCGMTCSVRTLYLAHKHDMRRKGVKMAQCGGYHPRDRQCALLKKRYDPSNNVRDQTAFNAGEVQQTKSR